MIARAPSRTLTLAAANLLIAAVALWPWLPLQAARNRAPEAPAQQSGPLRLASLAPFAAFHETVERPVFAPTRRPPAQAAPVLAGIASRYRLQGVLAAGKVRRALVAPVAGGPALELGEGDALETWTVKRIEAGRVVLASPAGEAVLDLRSATPATPKR